MTNLGPGEYTVEVTDLTYGCTNSATIVLENPDLISVDVTDIENVSCYGDNTGSAMYLSNLELLLTIITGQMTWVLILRVTIHLQKI